MSKFIASSTENSNSTSSVPITWHLPGTRQYPHHRPRTRQYPHQPSPILSIILNHLRTSIPWSFYYAATQFGNLYSTASSELLSHTICHVASWSHDCTKLLNVNYQIISKLSTRMETKFYNNLPKQAAKLRCPDVKWKVYCHDAVLTQIASINLKKVYTHSMYDRVVSPKNHKRIIELMIV